MFKRLVYFFVGCFAFLVLIAYFLLYTTAGNKLLKPYLKSQIASYYPGLELEFFELTPKKLRAKFNYQGFLDLDLNGSFSLFTQKLDLDLNGKSRSVRKPFEVRGDIRGEIRSFVTNLFTDVAGSKTRLVAEMQKLKLQRLFIDSKDLVLEDFLPLVVENNAVSGKVNFSFLGNVQTKGNFSLEVFNLKILRKIINYPFLNEILKNASSGQVTGKLDKDEIVDGSGVIKSERYQLELTHILGNINKIQAEYQLDIPSMKTLYPIVRKDFPVHFNGNFSYAKKLELSFDSQSFDGLVQGTLINDIFEVSFEQNSLFKLFAFLGIPQELDADVDGKLNYDTQKYSGDLKTKLTNFSIRHNQFFNLLRRYSGFDIQKENFQPFDFNLSFKNHSGLASFEIKGDHIDFVSQDFNVNFYDMSLDAPLSVGVNGNFINLRIAGSLQEPKLSFNLSDILKFKQIDKKIINKVQNFFKSL